MSGDHADATPVPGTQTPFKFTHFFFFKLRKSARGSFIVVNKENTQTGGRKLKESSSSCFCLFFSCEDASRLSATSCFAALSEYPEATWVKVCSLLYLSH